MTDMKKATTAAAAINGAVVEGNNEPQYAVPLKKEEKQALLESGFYFCWKDKRVYMSL